jgi:hypothetical protein
MRESDISSLVSGESPTTRTGDTGTVTENRTMQTFNQLTLEHANKDELKGLKTYRYTTRNGEDFFFSLVPFYKHDIFIASTTPDMEDAWITADLEAFGQPL